MSVRLTAARRALGSAYVSIAAPCIRGSIVIVPARRMLDTAHDVPGLFTFALGPKEPMHDSSLLIDAREKHTLIDNGGGGLSGEYVACARAAIFFGNAVGGVAGGAAQVSPPRTPALFL